MNKKPIQALQNHINKVKKLIRKSQYQKSWFEAQQQWEKIRNQQNEHLDVIVQNEPPQQEEKKASQQQKGKQLNVGCEFHHEIKSEQELIKYIVENQFYKVEVYMSEEQIEEFQQVFNKVDEIDGRNIGSIVGMAMLGFIGFIALGFTVFGVIAGGVLGVIMGRYAGKRIKRQLKRKRNKLVELDIFEIKLRCYLKWVKVQISKYKYNINQVRFIVDKLFLELIQLKPILHYKKFSPSQQKQIKEVLDKVFQLIKQPQIITALLLSFRLCQEYLNQLRKFSEIELKIEQKEQNNEIHLSEVNSQKRQELEICLVKGVDNLLKPIITITQDFKLKKGMLKQLQEEIEKFLLQPEIIHLGHQCPDPQMSLEFIKLFAEKMKCPVNTANLKNYLKDQNYRDLEMIGRLIEKEGMQRQITEYPTERTKHRNQSMLEKVEEQEDEENIEDENDENNEIEDEHYQVDKADLNKKIQLFVNRTCFQQKDHENQQQQQIQEQPNNEQEILEQHDIKKQSSSINSVIFQLNKADHPNRGITKQILQISGDEMIANITPMKKPFENFNSDHKSDCNELKRSRKISENEVGKSKQFKKGILELPLENQQLLKDSHQEIEIGQPQEKAIPEIQIYDEGTLIKFQQMTEILNESVSSWENVTKSDNIYIYKTMKPGKSNVFVRGNALLPGVDKETAFLAIYKQDFRTTWDKILQGFKIVASESELVDIVFYFVPAPVPIVATREFLQKRILRRDFPKKGQITLLFYSVPHEKQPIKKGNVRAETELAGYVFEEVQGGSQISFISNNDVKGAVPKILVNYASAKAPFTWFGNLRKACLLYKQYNGDLTKVKIK